MDVAVGIGDYCQRERCEFVLTLGDNFYSTGVWSVNDPQWQTKYRDVYGTLGIPFYATLGNHDAEDGNFRFQIEYSTVDSSWRMPDENYTFCWPENAFPCLVQIFVINSNGFNREVASQLRHWLVSSRATWKILAMHFPLYSNAINKKDFGDNPADHRNLLLPRICDQIDLVLSGHVHAFSHLRTNQDGCLIDQLIIGTGGHSELSEVDPADPRVQATGSFHGFGWLYVTPHKIVFRMIQKDGNLFYETSWEKAKTGGSFQQ